MITTFENFLNEKFDFEYDIKKEFDNLNKLLFDNEVPFPEISFDSDKKRVAWVTCKGTYTKSGWSDIYDIVLHFNKNLSLTPEQFKNTLAHEMIHLLLYQRKIFRDYGGDHGVIFSSEMDRINNMNVGIKISPKNDTISPFQQRQKSEKDFYVIFFNWKDEKILCPFSVKEECEKFWDIAMKSFKISSPKDLTLYMAKTILNEINFYSVARTAKNVKQYKIPEELYNKLIKESEIIRKENITK
jgi:hypothetical protein